MLTPGVIEDQIKALGPARVFVGNALATAGLVELGLVEGDPTVAITYLTSKLTARRTGGASHGTKKQIDTVVITLPVIVTKDVLPVIDPFGLTSGGDDRWVSPITTTILIIPESELGEGPQYLAHDGTAWTKGGVSGAASAPKLAFWGWKATVEPGDLVYRDATDGGDQKSPRDTRWELEWDGTKPRRHKLYTIGDPRAVTPTPIPVLI